MELVMEGTEIMHAAQAGAFKEVHEPYLEPHEEYTPRDFLWRFGAVIAICLGFAMLAQLMVYIVGD
jgi:hypothetical protein